MNDKIRALMDKRNEIDDEIKRAKEEQKIKHQKNMEEKYLGKYFKYSDYSLMSGNVIRLYEVIDVKNPRLICNTIETDFEGYFAFEALEELGQNDLGEEITKEEYNKGFEFFDLLRESK